MENLKLHRRLTTQIESDKIHLRASQAEISRKGNCIIVIFKFNFTDVSLRYTYSNYGMHLACGGVS